MPDYDREQDELNYLIKNIADGSKSAFYQFYKQTSGRAYSVALRMLGEATLAQDVLQDAYIKVWENARRYKADKGLVVSWLVSIVRYRALDLIRSNQRRGASIGEYQQVIQRLNASQAIDHLHTSDALAHCLSTLADTQRTSIIETFVYGLTYEELAKRVSKPLGTVKSRIRRGLIRLRECLEQ